MAQTIPPTSDDRSAFTLSIDWSPALGYEFTVVTAQGATGGQAANIETVLDELFSHLFVLGHGNRSHHALAEDLIG